MPIQQRRSMQASLWQSALDEATAKESGGGAAAFGGTGKPMTKRPMDQDIVANDEVTAAIEARDLKGQAMPEAAAPSAAAGVQDTVKFCSTTAFKLAEARVKAIFTRDDTEVKLLQQQLGATFGNCDPKWSEVIENYVRNRVAAQQIPYRPYNQISDYVFEDRLPGNALVALLADWGTGEDAAKNMLNRIAARKPDVVIHLGDVYYSGTDYEFQNYFYAIWQQTFALPKLNWNTKAAGPPTQPFTFTLAGNHDMYAGGAPYYTTIDMLGQPASYFCLRNADWQFIALDTGLHDSNPTQAGSPTYLEDTEVAWMKDKVTTGNGLKTVLLSHHQLFTGFEQEAIGGGPVNQKLQQQVADALPQVDVWFWGHEHNLVIFENYLGVLGRCIGHAAFPVPTTQPLTRNDVPVKLALVADPEEAFYPHGYVMMQLNGNAAVATYFQYDPVTDTETQIFSENL
jgi:predicted phosphodiesterase